MRPSGSVPFSRYPIDKESRVSIIPLFFFKAGLNVTTMLANVCWANYIRLFSTPCWEMLDEQFLLVQR